MDPQTNQAPGLGLPQPSFDMGQAPASHMPTAFQAPQPASHFDAAAPMSMVPGAPAPMAMPVTMQQPQPLQPTMPMMPGSDQLASPMVSPMMAAQPSLPPAQQMTQPMQPMSQQTPYDQQAPMAAAPQMPGQPQPMPTAAPAGLPVAAVPATGLSVPNAASVDDNDSTDDAADDAWIAKAHEIIGRTHADPFAQSQEISNLKAQYIKQRYNKDIKGAGE